MFQLNSSVINKGVYVHLFKRLFLVYVLYSVCRVCFFAFNHDFFPAVTLVEFMHILLGGLRFDTTAILYTNLVYLLAVLLPLPLRHNKAYQNTCTAIFIVTNSIAILANVADIPYYAFTQKRTTSVVFDQFANEQNMGGLLFSFVFDYWYATLLFLLMVWAFVWLTLRTGLHQRLCGHTVTYVVSGLVVLVVVGFLAWGGARGGFRHSTRPITLSNAGEYVEHPSHTAIVLNTPFAIIRTLGKNALPRLTFFDEPALAKTFDPERHPRPQGEFARKNIVIFILESFSREFVSSLNRGTGIKNYTGYTPFLDSLVDHGLSYKFAVANGKKSIEALPSVLASIPGMEVPFVLSHYSTNSINSIFSLLGDRGYSTAFFHGAPNGSMGFDAFVKMAGCQRYYGKNEYGNDDDFDGMWGIWDEPFFQYYARQMDTMRQPFCTSLFSVSSHHPFAVPRRYEGVFKQGTQPIHQCVGYTDNALRKFFATARSMPWYNNTIFVLTADHATFPCYQECNNSVDCFTIPLLFFAPDGSLTGMDSTTVAQQIDILPTLLSMLNYDKPYVSFGKNLLEKPNPNFAINYINDNYQVFADTLMMETDAKVVKRMFRYTSDRMLKHPVGDTVAGLLHFTRAFVQQYNNRMLDNRLTINNAKHKDN